jgi:hypothetical protein
VFPGTLGPFWLVCANAEALARGYPEGLARAIVQKNLPVLGTIISSYEQQIQAAFLRQDPVSLNHRAAAWLSSYFDILFAANRKFHPGEKRLLAHVENCQALPSQWLKTCERSARGLEAWSAVLWIALSLCGAVLKLGWKAKASSKNVLGRPERRKAVKEAYCLSCLNHSTPVVVNAIGPIFHRR